MSIGIYMVVGTAIAGFLNRFLVERITGVPKIATWFRIVAAVICVLGGWMTIHQMNHLKSYDIYKQWAMINGTVTDAQVTETMNTYRPKISYSYIVNGHTFSGSSDMDVPGFGGKQKMFDVAETTVRDMAPGSVIPVFYNPENPSDSKLRVTPTWNIFAQIGFGIVLVFCACFAVALPRK
jgi:hypothetical protein